MATEKRNIIKKILDTYNPKIIKGNLEKVRASPYKALKLQYQLSFVIICVVCVIIVWQLVHLIINMYDGRSNMMTMVSAGAIVLVMVMIVIKAFGILKPLKETLKHYENTPTTIGITHTETININKTVDDILSKYDKERK